MMRSPKPIPSVLTGHVQVISDSLDLLAILFFAPESPWYYVRTGQIQLAEKQVLRLGAPSQRHLAGAGP